MDVDTLCLPKLDVCGSSGGRTVSLLEQFEKHLQDSCTVEVRTSAVFQFL